jgi:copper chaperone CopZ
MKDKNFKTVRFETPALYGDHHVVEVRRILLELPGVEDVFASSSFHSVEVTYNPEKLVEEQIESAIAEAGYMGEMITSTETDVAAHLQKNRADSFFRHTAVFETSRETVTFAQNVAYFGRPLWNCPGMGVMKKMED